MLRHGMPHESMRIYIRSTIGATIVILSYKFVYSLGTADVVASEREEP